MLAQNLDSKCDQPIAHASQLLSSTEQNYITMERKTLTMVYTLHKFCHYFLSNRFVLYVDHMALTYLVNKPQLFGRIAKWLLFFWNMTLPSCTNKGIFIQWQMIYFLSLTTHNHREYLTIQQMPFYLLYNLTNCLMLGPIFSLGYSLIVTLWSTKRGLREKLYTSCYWRVTCITYTKTKY